MVDMSYFGHLLDKMIAIDIRMSFLLEPHNTGSADSYFLL